MLRRSTAVRIRPELDDYELSQALTDIRAPHQLQGFGADRTRPAWQPVADLLDATGTDWDRRTHRVSVLSRVLSPAAVDHWRNYAPDSVDAVVMRACVQAVRAAPGSVKEVGQAQTSCVRAAHIHPGDPAALIALLELMRERGLPTRRASPIWREIIRRDPGNRGAHHVVLRYLSPRAHGSVSDMTTFAWHAASQAPPGSPLALLPLAARAEHFAHALDSGGTKALGAHRIWHEKAAASELDLALRGWFHTAPAPHAAAVSDLNLLAFALVKARWLPDAARVFQRLGPHMTMFPWDTMEDPVKSFTYWRQRTGAV
ncbi:hypothetical protein ACIP88_17900 [Streptomyces uncialis]|uniref:hypothetical protein n=1 Tax=Streptomyces uncialis TaxID=1048205 RepID=UPI00380D6418